MKFVDVDSQEGKEFGEIVFMGMKDSGMIRESKVTITCRQSPIYMVQTLAIIGDKHNVQLIVNNHAHTAIIYSGIY